METASCRCCAATLTRPRAAINAVVQTGDVSRIEIRELEPDLWPDLEALFGSNGACGGCWCMYWRLEKGESWSDVKGATNRRRLRALVREGRAHGVVAYADGKPVGWASFERRRDLVRLDRAPSLACDDAH